MASQPPMGIGSMAGAPTQPVAAGAAPPQPTDIQAPAGEDGQQATPEEQKMYKAVVLAGLDIVVPEGGEEVAPAILASLKGEFPPEVAQMFAQAQPPIDPNPLDAAAVTATVIAMLAEQKIEANGQQIPNDILYHAGVEIIEYICNVSDAAGIHDFSEEDMEKVTYRAMDLYRTAAPRADQEALAGEFEQVLAADKAGQLGTLLPGVGQQQKA